MPSRCLITLIETYSSYLTSIVIANQIQKKFYNEDIPQLENVGFPVLSHFSVTHFLFDRSFVSLPEQSPCRSHCPSTERLQCHLVERFVKVLQYSHQLELNSLDGQKTRIENLNSKLNEVDIAEDQETFINLNLRTFVVPDDWKFEPSPLHYDSVSASLGNLKSFII
jgi:hypothetical protein